MTKSQSSAFYDLIGILVGWNSVADTISKPVKLSAIGAVLKRAKSASITHFQWRIFCYVPGVITNKTQEIPSPGELKYWSKCLVKLLTIFKIESRANCACSSLPALSVVAHLCTQYTFPVCFVIYLLFSHQFLFIAEHINLKSQF